MSMDNFEQIKNNIDKTLKDCIDNIYQFCSSVNMVEYISYSLYLSWMGFDSKKGYKYMCPLEFEYLMGVFLSLEYDENKIGKGTIQEIGKLLDDFKKLTATWKLSNSFRKIQGKTSKEDIDNALFEANLITTSGTMRGYSYYIPTEEIDIEIFTPYNKFLNETVGFNVASVKCFGNAVKKYYNDKILEFRENITEVVSNETNADDETFGIELFKALHNYSYYDIFFFSADDIIAIDKSIDKVSLEKFLDYFSVVPGYDLNNNYRYFNDTNIFKEHPIIKIYSKYLVFNFQMILWCIKDRFEETIKSNGKIWNKYNKSKSDYLECTTLNLFEKIFPRAVVYSSLYYSALDGKRCELDGLILYDNCILLVEAKSGIFSKAARNGGVKRLKKVIENNIEYAAHQAHRAKEYIEKSEAPIFEDEHKKVVLKLEKNGFENIYSINVTMEYFAELTVNLKQVQNLGYYEFDTFPWSVSLSDLKVISDFIQFPNQFLHYIYFREKFNNKVFVQSNFKHMFELDLFGFYLYEESQDLDSYFIDEVNESVITYNMYCDTAFCTDSKTPDFSSLYNYYYNNITIEKTLELPSKKYNLEYYHMVRQLEEYCDQGKGYTNIAIKLLDVDNQTQSKIIDVIHEMQYKSKQKNIAERKSFPYMHGNFDDKATFGITIITGYQKDRSTLLLDLQAICVKNRYQYQYPEWLGLCCFVDHTEHLVNNFVLVRDDTKSAAWLDDILKAIPKTKLKIGRNSPCPCGSGKKYKKCCGN